jgi:hypothetical protein
MEPYTSELLSRGVEVLYSDSADGRDWRTLLVDALKAVDIVWLCRPELCCKCLPLIREHSNVPVLYDTIDLHHVRMRMQAAHENKNDDTAWKHMQEIELACAAAADATIVVTDEEAAVMRAAGIDVIGVVPTIHNMETIRTNGYSATAGLVFIGGYNHTPNVDAARWLAEEIMPLVWRQIPDIHVTLLGSNPPESIRSLACKRISVPGFIEDVSPYFRSARLFVAPLRYGAGINGKIGQALGFAVPIVTTPVGAKGFGLSHLETAMVVEGAADFADAVVTLYRDRTLWDKLSAKSEERLAPFNSAEAVRKALKLLDLVLSVPGRSEFAALVASSS